MWEAPPEGKKGPPRRGLNPLGGKKKKGEKTHPVFPYNLWEPLPQPFWGGPSLGTPQTEEIPQECPEKVPPKEKVLPKAKLIQIKLPPVPR